MGFLVAVLVMVGLVSLFLATRKIKKKSGGTAQPTVKRTGKAALQARNPWRATSIAHDHRACAGVRAIGNKRFLDLDKNIPVLPLPDCDAAKCNCKYVYHEDRRKDDDDRRHPAALKSALFDKTGEPNRRQKKRGRRKTDWA